MELVTKDAPNKEDGEVREEIESLQKTSPSLVRKEKIPSPEPMQVRKSSSPERVQMRSQSPGHKKSSSPLQKKASPSFSAASQGQSRSRFLLIC